MAVREILAFPNPFLKKEAAAVQAFNEDLNQLANDMIETMHDSDGVGLAATQIGVDLQILILSDYVFQSEEQRAQIQREEASMGQDHVLINPAVLEESDTLLLDYEGCLSFPDVFVKVRRPSWVKIEAWDLTGERFELEANGFGARAILHEMDHLNGKVMVDHLSFVARKQALNRHRRVQRSLQNAKEA